MYEPKDYIDQLADYLINNLRKGYTLDALRFSLITQGYSRISVDNAIEAAHRKLAKRAPIMKEKPQIKYIQVVDDETLEQTPKKSWFKGLLGL